MKNLAFQTAPVGIIAVGGTFVFIAGGFDLSVGAISGFGAIIAGKAFLGTGVRVERFPGASHWVQIDETERVNAAMIGFLRG